MQLVPDLAGCVGAGEGEQLRVDELLDGIVGDEVGSVEERADHPGGEVGQAEKSEPAQRGTRCLVEGVVADRDGGADLLVTDDQLVEAPGLVAEPGGQLLQGPVPAGGQPDTDDPYGQW